MKGRKHVHEFRKGRSGSVETCSCGKFRFTQEYLAAHPPIVDTPRQTPYDIGTPVVSRDRKQTGQVIGLPFHCRMDGCRGLRVPVRWPDGKRTYPCSRGMTIEHHFLGSSAKYTWVIQ